MLDQESLLKAINQEIEIVKYDVAWPSLFQLEKDRILALFSDSILSIEHVGSTSIPNCPAKPIIDIIASVKSLEVADALLPQLCNNGYTTSAEFNETLKEARWLMRHKDGKRTHHLHLVLENSTNWNEKIQFRDILINNKLVLENYISLKLDLAKNLKQDREAYTEAKSMFIRDVLNGSTKISI